jgi:glucosyl-3-phosphoglycerate phosphatase
MRLLLVRHGQSEWNAVRRLQGQADIALSDLGREQARRLAPVIAALDISHALTSDLARAAETARLIGMGNASPTPGLREINVGDWTGAAITDLRATSPADYAAWRAGDFAPNGGELWAAFRARVVESVETARPTVGANLLVVCHGGVIRALLEHYLGLPPRRIIPVGPASLTALRLNGDDQGARLELFNHTPGIPDFDAPD